MDTNNWKWFRYDEIFDIKHGFYNKKPEDNPDGDIPFIGATDSNNGVTSHSDLETIADTSKTGDGNNAPMEEKIFENCIAVTNNGSVGYAYYQARPFTCTHDVNPLYLKGHELTPHIAMFLCTIIEKERFRWAYGRKWRPKRMPSSKIKLPVTPNGTPDWQFMEDFIKNSIIPQLPVKSQKVWLREYDTNPMLNRNLRLKTEDWKWFRVGQLFQLRKCKCSNATLLLEEGDEIAYVGAKKTDNGIMYYVKKVEELVTVGNCIVFIGDGQGSVGYCTYQPQDFIGSTTLIAGYRDNMNPYIANFLIAVLDIERYRYSFGRKYKKNVIENSKIKLPVTPSGEPDWKFMEDYIKSLPYSKNIEPTDPQEQIRALQRKLALTEHQLQAVQTAQEVKIIGGNVTFNDYSTNYNVKK